jgi:hypothetical protein
MQLGDLGAKSPFADLRLYVKTHGLHLKAKRKADLYAQIVDVLNNKRTLDLAICNHDEQEQDVMLESQFDAVHNEVPDERPNSMPFETPDSVPFEPPDSVPGERLDSVPFETPDERPDARNNEDVYFRHDTHTIVQTSNVNQTQLSFTLQECHFTGLNTRAMLERVNEFIVKHSQSCGSLLYVGMLFKPCKAELCKVESVVGPHEVASTRRKQWTHKPVQLLHAGVVTNPPNLQMNSDHTNIGKGTNRKRWQHLPVKLFNVGAKLHPKYRRCVGRQL